jgi:AcrR family transcriptional regulator
LNSAKKGPKVDRVDKPKPLKKQPKQKRSQEVVQAILGGATRILSQVQLGKATTDKIAELAGVGVGSLYDYFPNKKSIVLALIDARVESLIVGYEQMLDQSTDISVEELIDKSLAFITQEHLEKRFFLREIFLLAPESGRMELIFEARVRTAQKLTDHLIRHRGKSAEWAELKAFMLVHGVVGTLEGYVMTEGLTTLSAEALKQELRRMMKSLLELERNENES